MKRPRYQDFVDALKRGDQYGVFIDDTGSPGLATGNLDLHPERASWVAVIVRPNDMHEVLEQFPRALDEYSRLVVPLKEFHFADIYAGRREFRDVPIDLRLALFRLMAKLFRVYGFEIIVQTLDPKSLAALNGRMVCPKQVGPFNLDRPVDAALFHLLVRLKTHLQAQVPLRPARVFIDEGYKKNGKAIYLPVFERVFADGLICFASSSRIYPIQLADFAAFCINRTQLLLGKAELSSADEEFLQILSPIAMNYINIEKNVISLKDWSRRKKGSG